MPSAVFGPVLVPPWIRQRPLAIPGDWQGVPRRRVFAPHRGAALAALSGFRQSGTYGLLSVSITAPSAKAPCDDCLTSITDVDVLDGDGLGAACPELVEG